MKDDRLYLVYINECIERIVEYTAGGRDHFHTDRRTQNAVLRNLQVLAESTQRLSDAATARHPTIEWRAIAGFRNVLVHGYLGVDVERVWDIVQDDLPELHQSVALVMDEPLTGN